MAIQEQRNALTKKFGHFLNSMSPDRFVKYVMYITCMENVKLNQQNKEEIGRGKFCYNLIIAIILLTLCVSHSDFSRPLSKSLTLRVRRK